MTPGARVAAAIEILDDYLQGTPAEKALSVWARGHRFAGSKDRAAIRDHFFDALRRLSSSQALGGAQTGRATMIGLLRGNSVDLSTYFHGEGHSPSPLSDEELSTAEAPEMSRATRLDCPDWLLPLFDESLGAQADETLDALRHRAPVFLRVNRQVSTLAKAQESLLSEGIVTQPHRVSEMALEVLENPRKVNRSQAYLDGMVELQDVSSQAVVDELKIIPGMRVLDYCAGGGGKALAMAAYGAQVVAHDIDPNRMKDLPLRAARAGCEIELASTEELEDMEPFDLVLADAPCSGSGSWRRAPHGKWILNAERLQALQKMQSDILSELPQFVKKNGRIAYATCSVFQTENTAQIAAFSSRADITLNEEKSFSLTLGGDGFYLSVLSYLPD